MNRNGSEATYWKDPRMDVYKLDCIFKALGWKAHFHPNRVNYRCRRGDSEFILIKIYRDRQDIAYLTFTIGSGCPITLQQDLNVRMNLLDVIQDTIRKMRDPTEKDCSRCIINEVRTCGWLPKLEELEKFVKRTGFFRDEGLLLSI